MDRPGTLYKKKILHNYKKKITKIKNEKNVKI